MHQEDGFPKALGGIRLAWWTDLELTFNTDEKHAREGGGRLITRGLENESK